MRLNFTGCLTATDNPTNTFNRYQLPELLRTQNAPNINQLLSGGQIEWTGNYNFTIGAAMYEIAGIHYASANTNITLAPADPTNARIDVVLLDVTGNVVVLTGTPAPQPAVPVVSPATQLMLTAIFVAAGSTSPTQITRDDIYHSNTEWTTSQSSGAHYALASPNFPYDTTVDVEATNAPLNSWVQFQVPAAGTVDLATVNNLVFYVRNKAAWNSARSITIQWQSSGTLKGTAVLLRSGTFGFSTSLIGSYQQVAIPTSLFGINGIPVNQLRMTVTGTGVTTLGFYLDDITLQGGTGTITSPTGVMIWRGTWSVTTSYNQNDVVLGSNTFLYIALLPSIGTDPTTPSPATWQKLASDPIFVNGSGPISNANFNNTTPAAGGGMTNVTWQHSGTSVSAEVPTAGGGSNITYGDGAITLGGAAPNIQGTDSSLGSFALSSSGGHAALQLLDGNNNSVTCGSSTPNCVWTDNTNTTTVNQTSVSTKILAFIANNGLPTASTHAGNTFIITDSSTVAVEGQPCVESGTATALAFSDGTQWKCF